MNRIFSTTAPTTCENSPFGGYVITLANSIYFVYGCKDTGTITKVSYFTDHSMLQLSKLPSARCQSSALSTRKCPTSRYLGRKRLLTNFIHLCTADTNAAAKTTPWERVNTTWRSVRCWWIVSNVPKTGLLLITRYAIVSSCSMRGFLGRVSCISVFDLVAGWMLPVSITA